MTERLDLYKCNVCGNLIEVILPGVGELVCCGEPMEYLEAKKSDSEYGEKHVPVFSATDEKGEEVRVGSTLHPMTEEHYIQFVETIAKDRRRTELEYFYPSDEPIML
ncbi:MAG: desulfoferrodoxin FeS4 iron-binding domain-containing protein, partial [Candidatus Gastranaerophilales bacterium]|nr:desulfoferrodoxin FeS4 iron-binding domain-containing protein [Candidatus Gastranaerophilales bacterium]